MTAPQFSTHRHLPDPSAALESSSLGGSVASDLAARAQGPRLDDLVSRATTHSSSRGPSSAPPAALLSSRPEEAAALVRDAVSGDGRAVETLLQSIRPLVVRYCRARVGRHERSFSSADDVAQEVCLAVLTALPTYREQGRPFLAFVYGIAAHKVADAHRAAGRNKAESMWELPDGPEHAPGPEQRALQGELSGELGELLRTLPPKQREIVVLRVVVGLSAEETAEAVGSTPGAVRVAQHRALSTLRKALEASAATE